MKVWLTATHGVSSLEADENGNSGGLQQWRTRGWRQLDDFHSPNLTVSGEDVGKQGCAEIKFFFFFFLLCALFVEV
jgi:hypothetical protein